MEAYFLFDKLLLDFNDCIPDLTFNFKYIEFQGWPVGFHMCSASLLAEVFHRCRHVLLLQTGPGPWNLKLDYRPLGFVE